MGLDEVFEIVKSQILSTKLTPTLGKAYHLILWDKQTRLIITTRQPTIKAIVFQSSSYGWQNRSVGDQKLNKMENALITIKRLVTPKTNVLNLQVTQISGNKLMTMTELGVNVEAYL